VVQRVCGGIALLFHDHGTRRGWVVSSTPRLYFTPGKKTRYPFYRRLGRPQCRFGQVRKISPPDWDFFFTMILYWSRYRLYICKSILSRQTFASFNSRCLTAGAVASDAPCLTIGSSSLCFFLLLFLGTVSFAVLLLCSFRGP